MLAVVGYAGISLFNQLVGTGAQSLLQAFGNTLRPVAFLVMVVANILLGGAIYYGFIVSSAAVPVMLTLGVLTTMAYSVLFLQTPLTTMNIFGVLLIIVGIYFLQH